VSERWAWPKGTDEEEGTDHVEKDGAVDEHAENDEAESHLKEEA
jgi:hypothetical protein